MRNTNDEIEYLNRKLKSIYVALSNAPDRQLKYKHGLSERAVSVEKEIKRLEHIINMTPNTLSETLGLLATMLRITNEYSHVEDEVLDVKRVIQAKYDELDAEENRRFEAK